MSSDYIRINGSEMHIQRTGDPALPVILFLHGFTGSTSTWEGIAEQLKETFHIVSIDLWGHGRSAQPENLTAYAMEQQTMDLEQAVDKLGLDKFHLVGYSMGGRIALGYAIAFPERIQTLVLESASPGLKTKAERTERKQRDAKLAERLLEEPIEDFMDFWESLALFDSQKSLPLEVREKIRKERVSQEPKGLAGSLLGIGTGSQPSFWEALSGQTFRVLLLTGSLDVKFEAIACEMEKLLPCAEHISVKQAGHAIHVEKPAEFATIIKDSLTPN